MLYFNMQTKAACKFFKWLDKPTCARGVKVLDEITKKLNKAEDANGTMAVRIKDLVNENVSCMERVRQSIIRCLEKENDSYRRREKFFMHALFLSWFTILLTACVALMK
jgi:hypothetical protein